MSFFFVLEVLLATICVLGDFNLGVKTTVLEAVELFMLDLGFYPI